MIEQAKTASSPVEPSAELITMLGITKEELIERTIDRIATGLLQNVSIDDEEREYYHDSSLQGRLRKLVQERIDLKVAEVAEREVLPKVGAFVENLTLAETNKWGEKTGKKMTFIEYLVARAEAYLTEAVNYEGKSADECQNSYSFRKDTTRVAYLVNRHLQNSIEAAMKAAVADANAAIVGGLEAAVKMALEDVGQKLKVTVKV